jgi:hypothetical protein
MKLCLRGLKFITIGQGVPPLQYFSREDGHLQTKPLATLCAGSKKISRGSVAWFSRQIIATNTNIWMVRGRLVLSRVKWCVPEGSASGNETPPGRKPHCVRTPTSVLITSRIAAPKLCTAKGSIITILLTFFFNWLLQSLSDLGLP